MTFAFLTDSAVRGKAIHKHSAVAVVTALAVCVALTCLPSSARAQWGTGLVDRGAALLGSKLDGIGTTGRVLTIAAHPDDEDTPLIAWLTRGEHVETAYLSLTRGDGGQNLIGDELGESLGAIRTQELLAARRIDGGRQFFTRAYDFGFSKNAEETFQHWPHDSILGDVVRVVRAYRPHVIVAFFSGTPRDGHGHHQVSGILAREAWDLAGDTLRFPVKDYGLPWTPLKFYRSGRQSPNTANLRINTGKYDPLLGRSYYEIAAESRSQHKSQGFGVLQRKGVMWTYLIREASRVGPDNPNDERTLFDGVDTTWAGRRRAVPVRVAPVLDSALAAVASARATYKTDDPSPLVPQLARALKQFRSVREALGSAPAALASDIAGDAASLGSRLSTQANPELWDALSLAIDRTQQALLAAAGVAVEATATKATFPVREASKRNVNDSLAVNLRIYNRGRTLIELTAASMLGTTPGTSEAVRVQVAPDSTASLTRYAVASSPDTPWWRARGRQGHDWFLASLDSRDEAQREASLATQAAVSLNVGGVATSVVVPVIYHYADPVKGDQQVPVAAVPGIITNLASGVEYLSADVPVDREVQVRVQSSYPDQVSLRVRLEVPEGLKADSIERVRVLPASGSAVVSFHLSGSLKEGAHQLRAVAYHEGVSATMSESTISYDHIRPMHLYGASNTLYSAVSVAIPTGIRVGYILGVADGGLDALRQLGIPAERLDPSALATTDLSGFTSIVVGPRAYESNPEMLRQNPRLMEYVERGGTLVVQYGAQDMSRFPVMPYPMQWTRPAARVTIEQAPVTVLEPANPLLSSPNKISARDWEGWVQERSTYMPSTFDSHYTGLLAMNDPGEPVNNGSLLAAQFGSGRYVYVTLALFRQFPAGVPGAARLLVNLVSGAR